MILKEDRAGAVRHRQDRRLRHWRHLARRRRRQAARRPSSSRRPASWPCRPTIVIKALGDYTGVSTTRASAARTSARTWRSCSAGIHIVIGTPGRVFDLINRRAIFTDKVKLFVLDEADEMLDTGFKDQIYDIFRFCHRSARRPLLGDDGPTCSDHGEVHARPYCRSSSSRSS